MLSVQRMNVRSMPGKERLSNTAANTSKEKVNDRRCWCEVLGEASRRREETAPG